jgi:hypothetical protein
MLDEKEKNRALIRYYENKLREEFYKPAMDSLYEDSETEEGVFPDSRLHFVDGASYACEELMQGTAGLLAEIHLVNEENERLALELAMVHAVANDIFRAGQMIVEMRENQGKR